MVGKFLPALSGFLGGQLALLLVFLLVELLLFLLLGLFFVFLTAFFSHRVSPCIVLLQGQVGGGGQTPPRLIPLYSYFPGIETVPIFSEGSLDYLLKRANTASGSPLSGSLIYEVE